MVDRRKQEERIQAIPNESQRLVESSRLWVKFVLRLNMYLCTLQIKGAELILSFFILRGEGTQEKQD